ncbi:MAG: VOC family protein [Pseudomonadota bacterium]
MSIWANAKQTKSIDDSVVNFPTKTRLHIAVNVKNCADLINFYNTLFGCSYHTKREGYVKYDLSEPPLNISLNQVPKNAKSNGVFGIQAKKIKHLEKMEKRLSDAGLRYKAKYIGKELCEININDPEGNIWQLSIFEH